MLQTIECIKNSRVLSKEEQKEVTGGKRPLKQCGEGGSCAPGTCCRDNTCIDDTPGEDGKIPACGPR
jgi:hypothetical protein